MKVYLHRPPFSLDRAVAYGTTADGIMQEPWWQCLSKCAAVGEFVNATLAPWNGTIACSLLREVTSTNITL